MFFLWALFTAGGSVSTFFATRPWIHCSENECPLFAHASFPPRLTAILLRSLCRRSASSRAASLSLRSLAASRLACFAAALRVWMLSSLRDDVVWVWCMCCAHHVRDRGTEQRYGREPAGPVSAEQVKRTRDETCAPRLTSLEKTDPSTYKYIANKTSLLG